MKLGISLTVKIGFLWVNASILFSLFFTDFSMYKIWQLVTEFIFVIGLTESDRPFIIFPLNRLKL